MKTTPAFMAIALAGTAAFGASLASATTTTVLPNSLGEPDHATIISQLYGAGVSAARVDDDLDQLWSGVFEATAKASFATRSQSFGTIDGGAFASLFDVTGTGYSVTGSGLLSGSDLVLGLESTKYTTSLFSSIAADNAKGDRLVTYVLTGDGFSTPTYLLFWEDLAGGADLDFQDLVVELKGMGSTLIPTPAALGAGLMLIGGTLLRRRSA